MKRYDILIIGAGTIEDKIKIVSVRKVFEFLDLLPFNYVLKMHPRMIKRNNLYTGLFKNASEFPRYMPIEFYFQFIRNCIIAIMSSSLIIASKFDNLNAVSILECVKWYNQTYKTEIKDWLIKESDRNIIFPNNLNELRITISDIRK